MSEWRRTTIGDVLTFQRGFDITRDQQQEGSIPVVSSGGIGSFHDTAAATGPGVVIGRKGTLGKVFYISTDYWPHDTTLWVKDFKGNIPRFVYYFMKHLDVLWLDAGSANPTLNRNHLHPLAILWPPANEQQAISDVLGALDDKISTNVAAITVLSRLGSLELGREPLGGRTFNLGELVDNGSLTVGDGYRTKRSELAGSGFRIIRVADVQSGEISVASPDFVALQYERVIGNKHGVVGDVLLTTKGTVGRVAMLPELDELVVYSPQLCFFRVLDPSFLGPNFLLFWLQGNEFRRQISSAMHNSDMAPYVSLRDLKSILITLPTADQLTRLEANLGSLESYAASLRKENQLLGQLRDTLLPQLMSGKLRVKDAEKIVSDEV